MISVMDIKLEVIKAAFGLQSVDEPELLRRLEGLYLSGYERGAKDARELIEGRLIELQDAREFITSVSVQTPEKPDYWASCSQCEWNTRSAEDYLDKWKRPAVIGSKVR